MRKSLCLAIILSISTCLAADQLADKWQKRITDAETVYTAAVVKADNARFFAVQKANGDRLKVLKSAMSEATKSGDFNAATAFKEKVANAEKDGATRPKPKNTVKFGGHEYALIEDQATWHVAKKLCEEMGGHLATIESDSENQALLDLCGTSKAEPWIGATDELQEGVWRWVNGAPFTLKIHQDNRADIQHYLLFHPVLGTWDDGDGGARHSFICEWE
jgi:hypothetical protein